MVNYYLDTSAFVKLYVEEKGSDVVRTLAEDYDSNELIISDLTLLEARSAIRRRERQADVSAEDAISILERMIAHAAN